MSDREGERGRLNLKRKGLMGSCCCCGCGGEDGGTGMGRKFSSGLEGWGGVAKTLSLRFIVKCVCHCVYAEVWYPRSRSDSARSFFG